MFKVIFISLANALLQYFVRTVGRFRSKILLFKEENKRSKRRHGYEFKISITCGIWYKHMDSFYLRWSQNALKCVSVARRSTKMSDPTPTFIFHEPLSKQMDATRLTATGFCCKKKKKKEKGFQETTSCDAKEKKQV